MRILFLFVIIGLSTSVSADFKYDSFMSELHGIKANSVDGKTPLESQRKKLNDMLSENSNNPWIWYALGELEWKYIGTLEHKDFYDEDGNVSSSSPIDSHALAKQKNISFGYYDKAYKYHLHGAPKLRTKMLLKLQQTARDIELQVDIHRTILKEESRVGGIFGPNNSKVEFRRALVSSMIRAKKYKMAILELDKIEQEFPDDKNHPAWRKAFTELINTKATKW